MRAFLWAFLIGAVIWRPLLVIASPSGPLEYPPEDYAGAQYIDSAGCVYTRQGSVWAPRLDRDGSVICGYPPSLPGHSGGAAIDRADMPMRLAVTLAEGLQDGDVLAAPDDQLRRQPVETPAPQSGPLSGLASAVEAVPAMRTAAADTPGGGGRLCGMLGYQDAGAGGSGGDTLGFCTGGAAALQPRVIREGGSGKPAALAKDEGPQQVAAPRHSDDRPSAEGRKRDVKSSEKAQRSAATTGHSEDARKTPTPARKAVDDAEMIPAGARYVQIGRYPVPAEADAAIRRLLDMGYPVVRGRKNEGASGGRLVMAGPFADRRAVVSALSFLRAAGYQRAFAR